MFTGFAKVDVRQDGAARTHICVYTSHISIYVSPIETVFHGFCVFVSSHVPDNLRLAAKCTDIHSFRLLNGDW